MKFRRLMSLSLLVLLQGASVAQQLDPHKLLEAEPTDTWPTYNGDYSGRRFSPLTQIHASNVSGLALAWMYRVKSERRCEGLQIRRSSPRRSW
jgi:glucose dehydrogenase